MGFLLRSKAEGNVGPLLPSSCRLPRAALSSLALLTTSNSWEWIGALQPWLPLVGARSLGKAAGPTRHPVPMRRCPAQRPRAGDVPGSSPALSKAWTEVRSQCCLLRPEGCAFFFLEASFPTAPSTSREKHPQNTTVLLRREQPAGVWKRSGENQKKKSTHPSFRPQYLSANSHQWSTPPTSFHPAKNPGKHLNSGTGGPRPRFSGSAHSAQPVGRDSGLF